MTQDNNCDTDIKTDLIESWSEIDWKSINRNVVKLRGRIYQAKICKKLRLLGTLQRLMLKSAAKSKSDKSAS